MLPVLKKADSNKNKKKRAMRKSGSVRVRWVLDRVAVSGMVVEVIVFDAGLAIGVDGEWVYV